MKAALIGAGKMGFPVSLAHCLVGGHEIYAYDVKSEIRNNIRHPETYLNNGYYYEPYIVKRARAALDSGRYHVVDTVDEAVKGADVVLVAVQTPSLADHSFDTQYIESAMREIGTAIGHHRHKFRAVIVISTVLPGTTRDRLLPALEASSGLKVGKSVGLDYSASFIAMGTCYEDAITPEFVLIGASDERTAKMVQDYYGPIVDSQEAALQYQSIYGVTRRTTPMLSMTYEEAELTKNVYNVHIGFKIIVANAVMELAHKLGHVNSDVVTSALGKANVRIVGPKYLKGGMGDGGVCHGRDALALSWVAQKNALSADPFDYIMQARSQQADWMAKFLMQYRKPIMVLGERYKASTNITDFSASKLVAAFLEYYNADYRFIDPITKVANSPVHPGVFLLALDEPALKEIAVSSAQSGDVVVDAWRCLSADERMKVVNAGATYVPLGDST